MNESDYKITPLWATPLFQSTLKNIPQECKDYIMKNVEYKRYPANNGFGSKSKFLLDIQALAPLKKVLTDDQKVTFKAIKVAYKEKFKTILKKGFINGACISSWSSS